jgi:hypothetical protein
MATEQWVETREAKQCGNSAHILLPKRFRGDRFRVERQDSDISNQESQRTFSDELPQDLQELTKSGMNQLPNPGAIVWRCNGCGLPKIEQATKNPNYQPLCPNHLDPDTMNTDECAQGMTKIDVLDGRTHWIMVVRNRLSELRASEPDEDSNPEREGWNDCLDAVLEEVQKLADEPRFRPGTTICRNDDQQ